MFCKVCGKEINDQAVICPNCGCAVSNSPTQQPTEEKKQKVNILAIVGFVLSLASLLLALWGTVAIAGLVCSIIGLVQIKNSEQGGRGLAIAGICVSVGSLAYTCYTLISLLTILGSL
ncbi:MAG: DUF4190 domain-containing protein [Clostridia bacterium]|nr:DUF4190 domain-containing protein [Clostridia bacterium]